MPLLAAVPAAAIIEGAVVVAVAPPALLAGCVTPPGDVALVAGLVLVRAGVELAAPVPDAPVIAVP
jgi:hypothetical protein